MIDIILFVLAWAAVAALPNKEKLNDNSDILK